MTANSYAFLIAPFVGWFAAQGIKFFFTLRKDGITFNDAIKSGGMPSSHSAFMASLATAIALLSGLDSVAFAIAFAVTAIIAYDAMGVRRTTGEQTDAIKKIAKKADISISLSHDARGHSPQEVVAGLVTGIATGFLTVVIL